MNKVMSKMNHTKLTFTPLALTGLALLSFSILASASTFADDAVDNISVFVPASCTMRATGNDSHTANINNGTYQADIGTTNIKAVCNDSEGFAIYAAGYTGSEIGDANSTKLLGATTNTAIETGTATGTNASDPSNWAMKVNVVTNPTPTYPIIIAGSSSDPEKQTGDPDFSNYTLVPSTYTKVAYRNNSTDTGDSATGANLTTTYAVYISGTQPADTYSGQVIYTLVHPHDHAVPDEFTSENLQSVAKWGHKVRMGQTVTVTDARDSNEYTVAKLADGRLWMTKNLRLDLSRANITAENTNNPTSAFLSEANSAQSSSEWCNTFDSTCLDQVVYNTSNIRNTTVDSDGHKYDEYGVYYNWYTATAGNGTYNMASGTVVTGDICPSGWHLPTGTNPSAGAPSAWVGEFWELTAALGGGIAADSSNYNTITGATGSERLRSNPNNFVFSGYYYVDSILDRGGYGQYWSSIKAPNNTAYSLSFMSDQISAGIAQYPVFLGMPVRCIAEPTHIGFDDALADAGKTKHNGYYEIQDVDSSICSAVSEGEIDELIDVRDDTVYKVGKLVDGNCWMLDNLALDPTDLTTAANMNESNTNASQAAINNLLNGGSTTTGWSNVAIAEVDTDFNDSTNSFVGGYTTPRINNGSKDSLVTSYGPSSTGGKAKVGIYYNYCAASAGTYCYAIDAGVDMPGTDIDATHDLCPTNWRMPTGVPNRGEYYVLAQLYGSIASEASSLQYTLSTPLAGVFLDSYPTHNLDECGYWWSSSFYDNEHYATMHNLYVSKTHVSAGELAAEPRSSGETMRCIVAK